MYHRSEKEAQTEQLHEYILSAFKPHKSDWYESQRALKQNQDTYQQFLKNEKYSGRNSRITALRFSTNQCSVFLHIGKYFFQNSYMVEVNVCTRFEDIVSSWSQDIEFKKNINILCEATVNLTFYIWLPKSNPSESEFAKCEVIFKGRSAAIIFQRIKICFVRSLWLWPLTCII